MSKSDKKVEEESLSKDKDLSQKNNQEKVEKVPEKEENIEEKFKATQEKLLRTMAEMENQRRS